MGIKTKAYMRTNCLTHEFDRTQIFSGTESRAVFVRRKPKLANRGGLLRVGLSGLVHSRTPVTTNGFLYATTEELSDGTTFKLSPEIIQGDLDGTSRGQGFGTEFRGSKGNKTRWVA
jgi:hypothetical protein